ncbi:MAG TPA: hypothetical protein ENN76_01875 [Euryarchaeota archaeon]|nr:hypothetical protein [Euryarchaeota archaeon]
MAARTYFDAAPGTPIYVITDGTYYMVLPNNTATFQHAVNLLPYLTTGDIEFFVDIPGGTPEGMYNGVYNFNIETADPAQAHVGTNW